MRTFLIAVLTLGPASWAADVNAGKSIYEKQCMSCHGPNGAAPPNVAKFQEGRMPDLRISRIQSMPNPDLAKIITDGKGKMRGVSSVTGPNLENLMA